MDGAVSLLRKVLAPPLKFLFAIFNVTMQEPTNNDTNGK
jgi:hypothetical protein